MPHLLLIEANSINDFSSLIQQFGFPLVLCLALLWFCYQVYKYMIAQVKEKDNLYRQQVAQHKELSAGILETQKDIVRILNGIERQLKHTE